MKESTKTTSRRSLLDQLKEKYRVVLQVTLDGVWVVRTQDGRILEVNDAYCEMIGYSREELLEMAVTDVEAKETPQETQSHTDKLIAEGYDRFETRQRRRDGRLIDVEVSVRYSALEGGIVVAFLRDITERKRAEKAILEYRDHLEDLVRERTRELADVNDELRREIEHRKSLQEEILAISSEERRRLGQELHDGVGQQLTGLAYLARSLCEELWGKGSPTGELAVKLANEILACRQATQTLAKGLIPLEIGAESLVPALATLTASVGEQTGIDCSLEVAQSAWLHDDETAFHLYRLVQEAVNNAVKHSAAKHIWVRLGNVGRGTMIQVCDDGVGIAADAASGTGTGLRIMRHRAKLIGGTLDVKPLDGGGTAVTCALPDDDAPSARADANE
jgi:PAS domain S-box-containing protein